MKLQLNEQTLNAYINAALNEELNEWLFDFGAQDRLNSRRMITGQGYGSKKRANGNFWGSANTDISNTDADEEVPQTLVGMIKKMEQGLVTIEQTAGLPGNYEGLAEKVAAYRNGGGFKMKQSLLNAINALSRLADRLNAVERQSGSNAIMESAGDYMDATVGGNAAIGVGKAAGEKTTAAQNLATRQAAYNKALNRFDAKPTNLNLNRGIGKEKAFITAQNAAKTEQQAIYKAAQEYSKVLQSSGRQLSKGGQVIGNTPEAIIKHYTNQNGAFDYKRFVSSIERNAPVQLKNNAELKNAVSGLNSVKPTGGFWAGQARNVQKGIEGVRKGSQTIKGAGEYGRYVSTLAKGAGKGTRVARAAGAAKTTGQVLKGAGQIAKGVGQITQIPMLLLTIADEAARQGAEARQRKIVRTYNCASVLAKRMANIAQEIADAQGGQEEAKTTEQLQEINVRKSRGFFESIENGMNELSAVMKQIYAQLKGQSTSNGNELPTSLNTPEEISQFQEWANARGFRDERGQELVPDGIWGTHTEHAYDQAAVAQRQGQLEESRKPINEANAVMRALTDLENKVGVTGSGGRGYSDISRMSGAYNGSRSQGARAAKFIIRTYPPVLNQYLGVLNDAGANVQGIQPLKVDNRPHRDYDWNEVQEIDTRIKQLLNIANNLEVQPGPGRRGNVTLPPKPVRQSSQTQNPGNQQQRAPEVPELDNTVEVEDEPIGPIEDEPIEMKPNEPLSVTKFGYANPKTGEQLQPWQYVDSIIDYMKDALNGDTNSIRSKRKEMREIYQKAWDTIDQNMRTGVYTEEQAMAQKKKLNYYYRQFKRGKEDITPRYTVSEEVFKKLVKQIIRESMNY